MPSVSTQTAVALISAAGAAAALTEMRFPSIVGDPVPPMDVLRLLLGSLALAVALDGSSHSWRLPWRHCGSTILLAFFGCLLAGWAGGVSWPNSGDEYSYVFLADTFRAGRLGIRRRRIRCCSARSTSWSRTAGPSAPTRLPGPPCSCHFGRCGPCGLPILS